MNAGFFDFLSKDNSLNSKERLTNSYTKNKSFRQAFCLLETCNTCIKKYFCGYLAAYACM